LNGINGTVKKTAETEKASQRQRNLCDVDGTERNLHHLMDIRWGRDCPCVLSQTIL